MQDQPMMRPQPKRGRGMFIEHFFDSQRRFTFGEARAIANAEDMRVDSKGFGAKGRVHHNIGSFAAHTGQAFQNIPVSRHLAAIIPL